MKNSNALLGKTLKSVSRSLFSRRWWHLSFKDGTEINVGLSEILKLNEAKRISGFNTQTLLLSCSPLP